MNLTTCSNDYDCPELNQLCFKEVSWDPRASFCTCNTFYGWEGEGCLEISTPLYVFIGVQSFLALGTLIVLARSLKITFSIFRAKTGRGLFVLGGGLRTLISWSLSVAFFVLFAFFLLFLILDVTNPQDFGKVNFTFVGDVQKQGTYTPWNLSFLSMSMVAFMISSVNLGLIWNELSNRDTREEDKQALNRLIRRLLFSVQAFLSVAMLVFLIIGQYANIGITFCVITIILTGVIIVGAIRYRKALSRSDRRVDKLVLRTVIIIVPCYVFLAGTMFLFVGVVIAGVKETSPEGGMSLAALFFHMFLFFAWVIQVAIFAYLQTLLHLQFETIKEMTGVKKSKSKQLSPSL